VWITVCVPVLLAAPFWTLAACAAAPHPTAHRGASSTTFELLDDAPDGARWTATTPAAWSRAGSAAGVVLELRGEPDTYEPAVRSPKRLALLEGLAFGDFDLSVEAQQTSREYGHRDLCVVFGFEAADRFYYAHFATTPDEHAGNLFLVDRAPRRRLADVPAAGVDWGSVDPAAATWHTLRVRRAGELLEAFFDGELVVSARDPTLGVGLIGVGSFDDSGRFRRLTIRGAGLPASSAPFAPLR